MSRVIGLGFAFLLIVAFPAGAGQFYRGGTLPNGAKVGVAGATNPNTGTRVRGVEVYNPKTGQLYQRGTYFNSNTGRWQRGSRTISR